MGRKKIEIKAIDNKKNRIDTFHKRKVGLVKKAAELSMLCGIKMLVAFEDLSGGVFKYSTHGIFEPAEYFKEAWVNSSSAKTSEDYPDFFVKIPKKRKNRKGADEELDEEKSDDDSEDANPISPPQKMQIERPAQRDSIFELLGELEKKLSLLQQPNADARPETGTHPHSTQELLNTVTQSIEKIKRRQSDLFQFSAPEGLQEVESKVRRKTVDSSLKGPNKNPPRGGGRPNDSAQNSKRNTLDLDADRSFQQAVFKKMGSVINEETEFGEVSSVSSSDESKDLQDDFMEEEEEENERRRRSGFDFIPLPGQAQFLLEANNRSLENIGQNADLSKNSILNSLENNKFFMQSVAPRARTSSIFRDDKFLPTDREAMNKSSSGDFVQQAEVSKNNTKDFWMNLSRLEGSMDQSMMKEEQNCEVPKGRKSLFSQDGDNSGLGLMCPFPLTSMTAQRRSENLDWVAFSLKPQPDIRNLSFEQLGISFQSDASIMMSPRVEKRVKDS